MTNELQNATSPYLLQHKDNPVWWKAWSEKAFEQAKKENKLVFLSVGYSTCHWCHVMEKDSFEKQDVADVLNQHYVSIKLDREERPDVDSFYMSAVQSMSGRGGWPMSVILLPDAKPVWAGTFIPHDAFIDLLLKAQKLWKSEPHHLIENGRQILDHLSQVNQIPPLKGMTLSTRPVENLVRAFERTFDLRWGGSQGAPKFPAAFTLMMLLRSAKKGDETALKMATTTLDRMLEGGIFDHVGGGFHRYSVDEKWLVPHFEKMLYDNALMSSVLTEAYQLTKRNHYLNGARRINEYVLRDLRHPEGAFFAAEDADSEGIEGKFYVWTREELKAVLSPHEYQVLETHFDISGEDNFHVHKTEDEMIARQKSLPPALSGFVLSLKDSVDHLPVGVFEVLKRLFAKREARPRPHLDNKILVAWNGLMISALCKYAQATGDSDVLAKAQTAGAFILKNLKTANGLCRTWRDGILGPSAQSEDYACLIQSLIDLYETDFDSSWLDQALLLDQEMESQFWDFAEGGFFDHNGGDPFLLQRKKSFEDNVTPSTNSVACLNALRLFHLTGEKKFKVRVEAIFQAGGQYIENYPQACPYLIQALDRYLSSEYEFTRIGPQETALRDFARLRQDFLPYATWKNESQNTQPTYMVCQNQTCSRPVTDPEELKSRL